MNIENAEHEESSPDAERLVVSKLTCSLIDVEGKIFLSHGTRARDIYGKEESEESFRCNFGLNPKYFPVFEETSFRFSGKGEDGAPRLMELTDHPFYMGTLFLPQIRSDASHVHPIIDAYFDAVVQNATH